jgi:hypothetical protein
MITPLERPLALYAADEVLNQLLLQEPGDEITNATRLLLAWCAMSCVTVPPNSDPSNLKLIGRTASDLSREALLTIKPASIRTNWSIART